MKLRIRNGKQSHRDTEAYNIRLRVSVSPWLVAAGPTS
jgi:hypothetical protein